MARPEPVGAELADGEVLVAVDVDVAESGDGLAKATARRRALERERGRLPCRGCGEESGGKESGDQALDLHGMGSVFGVLGCRGEALRKIANRAEHWRAEKRDAEREVARDASVPESSDDDLLACYATLSTPSRHAIAREEVVRFEHAFEGLSEEHREVITLAHLLGLTRREIAEQTGRSEVAVRSLLYRGLARLAELLEERD